MSSQLVSTAQQEPLSPLPSHPFQAETWGSVQGVLGWVSGDEGALRFTVNLHQALPITVPQLLDLKMAGGEILKTFRGVILQGVLFQNRSARPGPLEGQRPLRPKGMLT